MSCRNCGNELPDGATFCPRCGARMVAASMLQVNAEGLLEPVEVINRDKMKSSDLSSDVEGMKKVGGAKDVNVVKSNATQPRLTAVKPVTVASALTPEQISKPHTAAKVVPEVGMSPGLKEYDRDDSRGKDAPGVRSYINRQKVETEDESGVEKKHDTGLLKLWKVIKGVKE